MLRTNEWQNFVQRILSVQDADLITNRGNLSIRVHLSGQPGSGLAVPDIPQEVKDSPVYRVIEKKAKQAKRWERSGKKYLPLLVVLGTEDDLRVDPDRMSGISAKQAIYAALTCAETLDMSTCYNLIGPWATQNFNGTRTRFRVKSSELISGLVFATFTRKPSILGRDADDIHSVGGMFCKFHYYRNLHPSCDIDNDLLEDMKAFDLNKYRYTSLDRAWESRDQGDLLQRARKRGGGMSIQNLGGHVFELKIPAILCAQILAGSMNSDEAWDRCPDFKIGERIKDALSRGQEIIEAEIINPENMSKEPMMRLRFSSPRSPVIRGAKRPKT